MKSYKKGNVWRVTFDGASPSDSAKIEGCFAQKQKARVSAVTAWVKVGVGMYDLTWKAECGYKSVYSWIQNCTLHFEEDIHLDLGLET